MKLEHPTTHKRVDLASLIRRVGGGRMGIRARSVVLTNGAFDPFHVGHKRYLEAAAHHAEILVAAVNSDRSTRAYKGPTRPVVPEDERAEILCALQCVDYVIVFDEPTVSSVIETLQPDVHAKGTDYTKDSVPERAQVEAYGGQTVICGDPKGHSSSELIATLQSLSPGDG